MASVPPSSPFLESPDGTPGSAVKPSGSNRRRATTSLDKISQLTELVHSLEYQLQAEKDSRERDRINHENSIRELEDRVNREGKRADGLESDQSFLFNRHKEATDELAKLKDAHMQDKQRCEDVIRELRDQLAKTEVEYEDAVSEIQTIRSQTARDADQLSMENKTLHGSLEAVNSEVQRLNDELRQKQQLLAERDGELEQYRRRADSNRESQDDSHEQELEALQGEISGLLAHSRQVEDLVAKQESELRTLREEMRLAAVVEEEKNSLASKIQRLEHENERLSHFEIRVVDLEQERKRWQLYLDSSDEFNSPEEIAKALVHARLESVRLKERLGELEAQIAEAAPDSDFASEISKLQADLEDIRLKLSAELQTKLRLQKQNELLSRETEMLREQLKSYQQTEGAGQGTPERVAELEKLLEQHKAESNKLRSALAEREGLVAKLNSPKRPRASDNGESGDTERLAEQVRKTRNLQAEVDRMRSVLAESQKEIDVLQERLKGAEAVTQTKQRILELRANPTAAHEAIKREMLETLRKENEDLLAVVEKSDLSSDKLVPISTLERSKADLRELERTIAEQNKRMTRLKEVFSKKSVEFRDSVFQLLGYRIDLLPNKKVRATSIFAAENESFTFLADSKGKKFVGIEKSPLSTEYDNLVSFWIKERNDIPCFLAAINLELYDKTKGQIP
jgi:mitotic spindle assembly checkpoint protein MAD1